jgi:futalosine hydrolase
MKVLIVAATQLELNYLRQVLQEENTAASGYAVTGVGLTASAASLMKIALLDRPALVVQVGIAGSFNPSIPLGSAVVVHEEVIADMGAEEKKGYQDIFALGLEDMNTHPFSNGKLVNPNQAWMDRTGLPRASAVSVNEISVEQKRIDRFVHQYGVDLESMEGMALHHVCLLQEIPFLQIRGISNRAGERDKSNWHIKTAMQSASRACAHLLKQIETKNQVP